MRATVVSVREDPEPAPTGADFERRTERRATAVGISDLYGNVLLKRYTS
jgi:hypothetical protein